MNRAILITVLLFTACSLSGDIIRVVPPSPNEFDAVKVDVAGLWRDSCVPFRPQVTVTGNRVDIRLTVFYGAGVGCLTSATPWSERVNVGVLSPGVYEIVATVLDTVGPSSQVARGPLIVRGASPFVLAPIGGSTTGREPVALSPREYVDLSTVTAVRFGGVEARIFNTQITSLVVETPPHAAGPVDVEIATNDGKTVRETAAFIYYDPTAPADPFVHAPILFPLSYEGPGAFGSRWVADNLLPPGRYKAAPPVDGGVIGSTGLLRLRTEPLGTGYLLYAVRGDQTSSGAICHCSSHARVTSTDDGEGTEVPVVREGDFVTASMRLLNLPALRGGRATLRLYALRGATCEASVPGGGLHTVALTRFADDRPFFGSIDMTEDLERLDAQATVNLLASCRDVTAAFWGMLTITDNATQHMTIISPQ